MERLAVGVALLLLIGCGSGEQGSRTLLQNKGSDTLVNVAQAWAEHYKDVNSNVAVAVTGGGSGTGISALINGTVDLANASRKMKEKEIQMARDNGIEPLEFVVGFDALAVFVHHDNPADSFTLQQLAEIYGEGGGTEEWSQLGIQVPGCGSDEIVRVSRQNNSGTYVYFKEAVLGKKRDYKLGREKRDEIVEKALRQVLLWDAVKDRLDRKATGLSLEEQQKLCIARLLPVKPSVLLMDEPCSALDPNGTEAVEELLWELRGKYTILIVTHNMAQARRASEECAFMLLGKMVEHGLTGEMFVSPQQKATADYIEGRYG